MHNKHSLDGVQNMLLMLYNKQDSVFKDNQTHTNITQMEFSKVWDFMKSQKEILKKVIFVLPTEEATVLLAILLFMMDQTGFLTVFNNHLMFIQVIMKNTFTE